MDGKAADIPRPRGPPGVPIDPNTQDDCTTFKTATPPIDVEYGSEEHLRVVYNLVTSLAHDEALWDDALPWAKFRLGHDAVTKQSRSTHFHLAALDDNHEAMRGGLSEEEWGALSEDAQHARLANAIEDGRVSVEHYLQNPRRWRKPPPFDIDSDDEAWLPEHDELSQRAVIVEKLDAFRAAWRTGSGNEDAWRPRVQDLVRELRLWKWPMSLFSAQAPAVDDPELVAGGCTLARRLLASPKRRGYELMRRDLILKAFGLAIGETFGVQRLRARNAFDAEAEKQRVDAIRRGLDPVERSALARMEDIVARCMRLERGERGGEGLVAEPKTDEDLETLHHMFTRLNMYHDDQWRAMTYTDVNAPTRDATGRPIQPWSTQLVSVDKVAKEAVVSKVTARDAELLAAQRISDDVRTLFHEVRSNCRDELRELWDAALGRRFPQFAFCALMSRANAEDALERGRLGESLASVIDAFSCLIPTAMFKPWERNPQMSWRERVFAGWTASRDSLASTAGASAADRRRREGRMGWTPEKQQDDRDIVHTLLLCMGRPGDLALAQELYHSKETPASEQERGKSTLVKTMWRCARAFNGTVNLAGNKPVVVAHKKAKKLVILRSFPFQKATKEYGDYLLIGLEGTERGRRAFRVWEAARRRYDEAKAEHQTAATALADAKRQTANALMNTMLTKRLKCGKTGDAYRVACEEAVKAADLATIRKGIDVKLLRANFGDAACTEERLAASCLQVWTAYKDDPSATNKHYHDKKKSYMQTLDDRSPADKAAYPNAWPTYAQRVQAYMQGAGTTELWHIGRDDEHYLFPNFRAVFETRDHRVHSKQFGSLTIASEADEAARRAALSTNLQALRASGGDEDRDEQEAEAEADEEAEAEAERLDEEAPSSDPEDEDSFVAEYDVCVQEAEEEARAEERASASARVSTKRKAASKSPTEARGTPDGGPSRTGCAVDKARKQRSRTSVGAGPEDAPPGGTASVGAAATATAEGPKAKGKRRAAHS